MLTTEDPKIREVMAQCLLIGDHWIWTGAISKAGDKRHLKDYQGYPSTRWQTKTIGVHRLICAAFHGAIPIGWEVDHTCNNTLCLNPDHLGAVTPEINRARRFEQITHCPKGHEYTEENTRWETRSGLTTGSVWKSRHCRTCEKFRQRRIRQMRRERSI